ncbi:glycosyltransferase family 4 protein [Paraglaciecola sp.]|uniref:glycosyltransferase family 4 protein n=1 Tax=Paraglaciecola sp. TaxID=1920173 RepID=UPI003EF17583
MLKKEQKVLFITRKWPPAVGGMETYSYELTKAFTNKVTLKTLVLPGKEDGAPPGMLAMLLFIMSSAWFIIRHGRQFDTIHIGDFVLAPLGLISKLFAKPAKVVIMIHGLDVLFGNRAGILARIYRIYQNIMSKLPIADHYIVNSENTGRICQDLSLTPVTVIPLGVNTDLPAVDTTKHNFKILFLGRLVVRKGALWFAKNVLPLLPPNFEFVVVGKTWDQSEQQGLEGCPKVNLVGYASNDLLSELKHQSCVAVMPNQPSENQTDVEGFGLVAAEISVQGIPLIASNIEGLTSAVINNETGFLLPNDDIEAWVAKIKDIANWDKENRHQYSEKCRSRAVAYYNWQRVATDTIEVYQKLQESQKEVA